MKETDNNPNALAEAHATVTTLRAKVEEQRRELKSLREDNLHLHRRLAHQLQPSAYAPASGAPGAACVG